MTLLSVANLKLSHGERVILNEISLSIDAGEKIGLVGRNGCGKSTLLRILADRLKPDDGQIQTPKSTRIGYMAQDHDLNKNNTLRQEAATAFGSLNELYEKLEVIAEQMGEADEEKLESLMKQYQRIEHDIEAAGGYSVDHKIDAVLHGLGLKDENFDVPVSGLSGGQKARLALAKLLLSKPDVLLLDEPTNHLDIDGCIWLESFLKEYKGAIIVVSHDRWMLDEVVEKIVEVEAGKLHEYPGNYHAYCEQRELRRLEQGRAFKKQQQYIRQEKQFIDRYRAGQRATQARGREKKLERFIESETVDQVQNEAVMNMHLPRAPRSGHIVVRSKGLSKVYDEKTLFEDFTFELTRGRKIGVIGPNGCGKSTLTRIMVGRLQPDEGEAELGTQLSVGYFDQSHLDVDPMDTPVTYLERHVPDTMEQSARDLAGGFLFSGRDQDKTLGVLSGGERARVVLAGLVAGQHNFLVFDEPTNHLDIPSAECLEVAIRQFDGTLLLVTHDRRLLDDTVEELLVFDGNGKVSHFEGNYSDYLRVLRQKKWDNDEAALRLAEEEKREKKKQKEKVKKQQKADPVLAHETKMSKKKKGNADTLLNDEKLEALIVELTDSLEAMDKKLADPEFYKDYEAFNKMHDDRMAVQARLQPLEDEWLRREEEREMG